MSNVNIIKAAFHFDLLHMYHFPLLNMMILYAMICKPMIHHILETQCRLVQSHDVEPKASTLATNHGVDHSASATTSRSGFWVADLFVLQVSKLVRYC